MAIEKTVVVKVEDDQAIRDIDNLNEALKETTETTEDLNEELSKPKEGLDEATQSAGKFKTAINRVGTALKATGILLVVAALTKMADIFRNSPAGAQIISQALETVNQAMYALWRNAGNFADVMGAILSGNFAKASALWSVAWIQIKEDMESAFEVGGRISEMEEQLRQLRNSNLEYVSQQQQIIEANRGIAENTENELRTRLAAYKEVEKASLAMTNARIREAKLEQEIITLRGTNTITEQQRMAELTAEINNAETERLTIIKDATNQRNALLDSNREAEIEFTKEGIDMRLEFEKALTDIELKELDKRLQAQKKANDEEERLRKQREDAAEAEKNARIDALDATGEALVKLSLIAGQETEKGKHLAAAAVLISSAVAIIRTWEGYAEFGPWGTAAAGIQTAVIGLATIAALDQIYNADSGQRQQFSGGGSAPSAPSYNVVGATQTTSVEEALLSNGVRIDQETPLKAYVVSTEVTSQQALDRSIEANASF